MLYAALSSIATIPKMSKKPHFVCRWILTTQSLLDDDQLQASRWIVLLTIPWISRMRVWENVVVSDIRTLNTAQIEKMISLSADQICESCTKLGGE